MIAHGPCKPVNEVCENVKGMVSKDKNRKTELFLLDDETYILKMACVYSGPTKVITKRRVSKNTMFAIIEMVMKLNGISHMKLDPECGLMWSKNQQGETP